MSADYTPAAGYAAFTPAYDAAVRIVTRERVWRRLLVDQVDPRDRETIVDVGCGTGSLAIMLKRQAPGARVIGLDPDPEILELARAKAEGAGVQIEWRRGYARDSAAFRGEVDKTVSSLVFHQVSGDEKEAGLTAMFAAVRPGGEVHLADYCRQPDRLMRGLFRIIQTLDGYAATQPNADGAVERLLERLSGTPVEPTALVRTPTGAISLFRARKKD